MYVPLRNKPVSISRSHQQTSTLESGPMKMSELTTICAEDPKRLEPENAVTIFP